MTEMRELNVSEFDVWLAFHCGKPCQTPYRYAGKARVNVADWFTSVFPVDGDEKYGSDVGRIVKKLCTSGRWVDTIGHGLLITTKQFIHLAYTSNKEIEIHSFRRA